MRKNKQPSQEEEDFMLYLFTGWSTKKKKKKKDDYCWKMIPGEVKTLYSWN